MYMLRAYQSPASAADCGPQWAQMPNLASRNHSGTWYCRSDSRVASKGVAALVRTGAARLPASKPRASLRVSVMCRAMLGFGRLRGIVRRGIVRVHAFQRVLKAANALGQALPEFRQLLRAEEQQGNGQDDQQVPGLEQIFNHVMPALIVPQPEDARFTPTRPRTFPQATHFSLWPFSTLHLCYIFGAYAQLGPTTHHKLPFEAKKWGYWPCASGGKATKCNTFLHYLI